MDTDMVWEVPGAERITPYVWIRAQLCAIQHIMFLLETTSTDTLTSLF